MGVLFSAAIVVTALVYAGKVLATAANGFVGQRLPRARWELSTSLITPFCQTRRHDDDKLWLSMQKTKGSSDLYVQSNVWQPGGSTGWHTHPGHSLIIVTEGTVTAYEGDDPECKPHVYTEGMGFVDPGGDMCTSSGTKARSRQAPSRSN